MEMTVQYAGGVSFEVDAGGHKVLCDQPENNGGEDKGMSPPEFLLASLGTCAAYYALQYLKTRSLPTEGLNVRVKAEKAMQPARLDSFEIEVEAPGADQDERHREGLLRAVKSCLIHNTLLNAPAIKIEIGQTVSSAR
jgi:putative redox protein